MTSRYKRPAYSLSHSEDYNAVIDWQDQELANEDAHLAAEAGAPQPRYKRGSTTVWRQCEDCNQFYERPIACNPETGWYVVEPKCRKCWSRAQ